MQALFHRMGQRALARTRKAGEPDYRRAMAVLLLAPLTGHRSVMPNGITAFRVHAMPFVQIQ